VQHNVEAGVKLENGANLVFEGNNVSYNAVGVLDARVCAGPQTCSTLAARANTFVENLGDGVRMQGASTWRGDVALGNEGDGFELNGGATLLGVVSRGNGGDGARIVGMFDVAEGNFTHNRGDGLEVVGAGALSDSSFLRNLGAGVRSRGTYVAAIRLNASHNFDGIAVGDATAGLGMPSVPTLTTPALLGYVWSAQAGGVVFDIHRSTLIGNERDAIRAGNSLVNATHNYFGRAEGPSINVLDQVGAFQNGVTPTVRVAPWYVDPQMTTTGPVHLL
ncbi:MAG TPA: hypothetical protein VM582_07295, partial [Candidatus Thermoplasmatota archaeon]|nr:hypothetical protein [Candidatus Thermoplasmatota archaeon]